MNYPDFFKQLPKIELKDDLALTLGSFKDGIVEFSYLDIVKISGHSCPTVIGGYFMVYKALKELYKDEIPKRGEIKVEFKDKQIDGVTGVLGNIVTAITGATTDFGFKGLNGKYNRCNLLSFNNNNIDGIIKFTRLDTKKFVIVDYDISSIKKPDKLISLMQKVLKNTATTNEKEEFGSMWQEGVWSIAKNIDNFIKVK